MNELTRVSLTSLHNNRLKGRTTLTNFAERLSIHGNVKRAAAEIDINEIYGYQLLKKIKLELGDQAK